MHAATLGPGSPTERRLNVASRARLSLALCRSAVAAAASGVAAPASRSALSLAFRIARRLLVGGSGPAIVTAPRNRALGANRGQGQTRVVHRTCCILARRPMQTLVLWARRVKANVGQE
jgi:hypothetical protein